jgi:hypothetical protein
LGGCTEGVDKRFEVAELLVPKQLANPAAKKLELAGSVVR